jgi:hypothetical protein
MSGVSASAADCPLGKLLSWMATFAALITLALQPELVLWLCVSSSILCRVEPAPREEW